MPAPFYRPVPLRSLLFVVATGQVTGHGCRTSLGSGTAAGLLHGRAWRRPLQTACQVQLDAVQAHVSLAEPWWGANPYHSRAPVDLISS